MMRAGRGDLQGTLGMGLTKDLRQVDVMRRRNSLRRLNRRRLVKRGALVPVNLELSKMSHADHRSRGGDLRLRHVPCRDIEAPDSQAVEVGDDRQRAPDRADGAIQCQLAKPGSVRGQAAVLGGVDDGGRHREVEATPLFRQLGRREVDGYFAAGKFEAAVVDRDLDAFASLLQRPIAQPHDVKSREPVGNVSLHLDPDAVEAEHRP